MKKIFRCLFVLLFCITFFASPFFAKSTAFASIEPEVNVSKQNFKTYYDEVLSDFCNFKERIPGTTGEKLAAEYIRLKFLEIKDDKSNIVAFENDASEMTGFQSFSCNSELSGKKIHTQNVIFTIKSENPNAKKVVFSCNYDAIILAKDNEISYELNNLEGGEGVNQSASSVAFLISLAKFLPNDLNFDVEFVFFGASVLGYSGAQYYSNGISENIRNNTLLAINVDNIAIGENLYFYVDEFSNEFSNCLKDMTSKSNLQIYEAKTENLGKTSIEANVLGLNYTHIAFSNNVFFMKNGIMSLNLFAGDYSSGIVIGRQEYAEKSAITFTENDSISYISENFGADEILGNSYKYYNMIYRILTDFDLENISSKYLSQRNTFYSIFGNQDLALFLTIVVFFVFLCIAIYVNYRLSLKSFDSKVETEFVSTIISISENVGGDVGDGENMDNVSKAVTQVVATDIKKYNKIKPTKKKK